MGRSKILSRILPVRTEKHHENVNQETRSLVGLKVGSLKYKTEVLSTGPRYSINILDHMQIYTYFEFRDIKFHTLAYM